MVIYYQTCMLLSNKTEITYMRTVGADSNPSSWCSTHHLIVDYEKAGINSFQHFWSTTNIKCCFFHFTQNIWRKVQLKARKHSTTLMKTLLWGYVSYQVLLLSSLSMSASTSKLWLSIYQCLHSKINFIFWTHLQGVDFLVATIKIRSIQLKYGTITMKSFREFLGLTTQSKHGIDFIMRLSDVTIQIFGGL